MPANLPRWIIFMKKKTKQNKQTIDLVSERMLKCVNLNSYTCVLSQIKQTLLTATVRKCFFFRLSLN